MLIEVGATLCQQAEADWQTAKRASWALALKLVAISDQQLYLQEGYGSIAAWATERLGISSPSWISKVVAAGRLRLNSPRGDEYEVHDVFNVVEIARFARKGPEQEDAALATLATGKPQAEIRRAVKALDTDQHEVAEWRHLSVNLPKEVHERWKQAANRARFALCKRNPGDAEILEAILEEWMQTALDPKMLRWVTEEQINAGEVKCRECGSYDRSGLGAHHVIPRSLASEDGPVVLLCHFPCHQQVTENHEGTWQHYAAKWNLDPDELRRQFGKGQPTNIIEEHEADARISP